VRDDIAYWYRFEGFGDDGVSLAVGGGYLSAVQLDVEGDVGGIDVLAGGRMGDLNAVIIFGEGVVEIPTFSRVYAGVLFKLVGRVGFTPTFVRVVFYFFFFFFIIGPSGT
jgi:hypothetical protein